jgi:hypothetical protein
MLVAALAACPPLFAEEEEADTPDGWQPPEQGQVVKSCYNRCLSDGNYAEVCSGICDAGDSKVPEKYAGHSYECFRSCRDNPDWGILFCEGRCLSWAHTLDVQDTELPPERGVQ